MAIRPSQPEIITVNSEALQTQIRDLLPSQNGFGSELQASNVITPIIDLTAAAEGSGLPISLAQAIAFGSQTAFSANNSTTVIGNSPGFYRIFGTASAKTTSAIDQTATFTMTDGVSVKTVFNFTITDNGGGTENNIAVLYDFIVWLAAGESISATSSAIEVFNTGSIRQVADSQGQTVNPSGYPL